MSCTDVHTCLGPDGTTCSYEGKQYTCEGVGIAYCPWDCGSKTCVQAGHYAVCLEPTGPPPPLTDIKLGDCTLEFDSSANCHKNSPDEYLCASGPKSFSGFSGACSWDLSTEPGVPGNLYLGVTGAGERISCNGKYWTIQKGNMPIC